MDFARRATGSSPRIWILLCGALAAVFVGGIVLAPILEMNDAPGGSLLRALYRPLCHQFPSRSLSLAARPLAVCSRCFGLYASGAMALLLAAVTFPRMRLARRSWLVAAWLPTVIDVTARFAGFPGLSTWPRLLVALPAGFIAGVFLAEGVADLAVLASSRTRCRPLDELATETRSAPNGA